MKYYYGFFRDTDSNNDPEGQLYKVVIKTGLDNSTITDEIELLLADNPFAVTYESSEDIYKPYKCSTAVVRLLNKEFMPDLNAINIQSVSVELYKAKKGYIYNDSYKTPYADEEFFDIEWSGYSTPNAYNQGYNSYLDVYELECQDKLSALKFVDANLEGVGITLKNLLVYAMSKIDIDYCILTENIKIPSATASSILDSVVISVKTLVDNEQERKKLLDVVGGLLSTLNLTIIQRKNELYIVSYDAIANGYTTYVRFDRLRNTELLCTIDDSKEIVKEESAANDMNLSLGEIYDKFSVISDHESLDLVFPDLSEWFNKIEYQTSESMTTKDAYIAGYLYSIYDNSNLYGEYAVAQYIRTIDDTPSINSWILYNFYGINPNVYNDKNVINVKCYCYEKDTQTSLADKSYYSPGALIQNYEPGNLTFLGGLEENDPIFARKNVVATPCSLCVVTDSEYLNNWGVIDESKMRHGIMIFHALRGTNDLTKYVYRDIAVDENILVRMPMVDFEVNDIAFGDTDCLVFNAKFNFSIDYMPTESNIKPETNELDFIPISVKIDNGVDTYYLYKDNNGDLLWTLSNNPIVIKANLDVTKETNAFNNDIGFRSATNKRKYKLAEDVEGFIIPSPSDRVYNGKLTITIYRPFGVSYTGRAVTTSTFISGVSLSTVNRNSTDTDDYSSTKYTYKNENDVLTNDFSLNLDYISYDRKKLSSNYIYNKQGSKSYYLDYISNISTGDVMRPEEMVLKAYGRQYSNNTIILNGTTHLDIGMLSKVTYKRFIDKNFIVNGLEINYGDNAKNIILVEKK